MKSRIKGWIAIGLLAAPMAARAGVIYQFEGAGFSTGQSFVYETDDFIASSTHLTAGSLQSCTTGDPSFGCISVDVTPNATATSDSIAFKMQSLTFGYSSTTGFYFDHGALGAYGTYATKFGKTSGTLTVSDSDAASAVPEPASVPLLAFSLVAAGLSMGRKNRQPPHRRDRPLRSPGTHQARVSPSRTASARGLPWERPMPAAHGAPVCLRRYAMMSARSAASATE